MWVDVGSVRDVPGPSFHWTSNSSGNAKAYGIRLSGLLVAAVVTPDQDSSYKPDDNYKVELLDTNTGRNVLLGRFDANTQNAPVRRSLGGENDPTTYVGQLQGVAGVQLDGMYILSISAAGNAKKGVVTLELR